MIELVPATIVHAPVISAMHRICFSDFWDEEAVRQMLAMPGAYGWVAAQGAEPAGMILCRAAAGEAEILTIAVLPPYRRAGLGKMLLQAGFDGAIAAGAREMFLEVADNNDRALALYLAQGFNEVGRRRRYYGPQTDALVMGKTF